MPPPSSHATWHTVPYQGGSCQATLFMPCRLPSYKRPALSHGFRPLPPALRPSCEVSAKEDQKPGSYLADRFGPLSSGYPTLTASADFCQPLPSLCNDGSTWQVGRSPRVRRATFIPYTRRIYFYIFRVIIGLWILLPPRPDVAASMRFLFVGPGLCLQLPPDSTSQWTPLLFG